MFKFRFITILLVVSCLACNISVLQAKLVRSSSKKMPSWIGKTTENKSKLFFSGSSSEQTSFETARKLAVSDALIQIIESLDLTMSVNSNKILTQTQNYMEDRTKSKTTDVRVLNTKVKDVYFEEHNSGKTTYNVYVLLEYSKKEYDKEKERLAQEYENYKQDIANRMTKANVLINENSYKEALVELFEALKIIDEYGVNRGLENGIVSQINSLLSKILFTAYYVSLGSISGITANVDVSFGEGGQKYSNADFDLKTLNNFSIDSVQSNEEGILSYQFNKVSYLKKANYKLELNLQKTYNLSDEFIQKYSFKPVYKELDFLGKDKNIYLKINIKDNELTNLIKSAIVQNGFNIVNNKKDCNLVLTVEVFMGEVDEMKLNVASGNSVLFISNANINAELTSNKDNKNINSVSFADKGFGKTKNKSYSDLLQKISISIINIL